MNILVLRNKTRILSKIFHESIKSVFTSKTSTSTNSSTKCCTTHSAATRENNSTGTSANNATSSRATTNQNGINNPIKKTRLSIDISSIIIPSS